jgi:hydroxymethylbilane synthase
LPKIGDKGLFTKELEDALETGAIDFVVHSLKDMPCQTMPDELIISGVPEREDPSDALVMSQRLRATKHCLDDLDEDSVIGTSSLRRIAQLKAKYTRFRFETIRGNLQTRFAKLDDETDKKFDAIILASAGLKRMGYQDRITQVTSDSYSPFFLLKYRVSNICSTTLKLHVSFYF